MEQIWICSFVMADGTKLWRRGSAAIINLPPMSKPLHSAHFQLEVPAEQDQPILT